MTPAALSGRGAGSSQRGRGARAPRPGQARRGPGAHVARVPEGHPADPHRVRRHRAGQRSGLPARRPARAGAQQLRLRRLDRAGRARARPHRLPAARRPRRRHERADLRARAGGLQVPLRLRRARWTPGTSWCWPTRSTTRPGFVLLSDVHESSTFGPWKRALAKVDKEETFHLRHGRTWVKKLVADPDEKRRLQASLDWMFILTLEWFGLPDERKRHGIQLEYGFKGMSNDELRQTWMAAVVPFMEEVGLDVPAHRDEDAGPLRHRLPVPGPLRRGAQALAARRGPDLVGRGAWSAGRRRGPMNEDYVERLQRGYRAYGGERMSALVTGAGRGQAAAGGPPRRAGGRGAAVARAARGRGPRDPDLRRGHGADRLDRLPRRTSARSTCELTFTAMGCPAMDFIEEDIRERLLRGARRRRGPHRGRLGSRVDAQPHPRGRARDDARAWGSWHDGDRSRDRRLGGVRAPAATRSRCTTSGTVTEDDEDLALVSARSIYDEQPWIHMIIVPRTAIREAIRA